MNVTNDQIDKKKVNDILSQVKIGASDKSKLLGYALNTCNYYELEYIYSKIPTIYKGLFSLSFLIRRDVARLYQTPIQPCASTIDYMGKLAYIIKKHAQKINLYIKYKTQVDSSFLKGDYDDARKMLKKINDEVSYSFWAIAYEIKMDRLQYGIQRSITTHNTYFHQNNCPIFQKFCNVAFHTSSLEYTTDIEKKVLFLGGEEYTYINNIIITHFLAYKGINEGDWFCSDMNSSIIDLYNNFIAYLPNFNTSTINKTEFKFFLKEINSVIHDPYLLKICYLLGLYFNNIYSLSKRQSIIHSYMIKDFQSVIDESTIYIEDNPLDIEVLCIYIKSCIASQKDTSISSKEGSIIHEIRLHLYNIFQPNIESSFHLTKLKGICQSLYHIDAIKHLHSIITAFGKNDLWSLCDNTWKYSPYLNVGDAIFYNDVDRRKEFINSLGVGINITDIFDTVAHPLSNDAYECSIGKQNNENIFKIIANGYKDGDFAPFLTPHIVSYIFNYYIGKNQYEDAIKFYVDNLTINDYISIQVEQQTINVIIDNHEYLVNKIPLELSIFYHSINIDIDTIYLTYKRYLRLSGVTKASDLQITGDKKQELFLANVASQKVLTLHVLNFKTIEQVMDERINICTHLYDYYDNRRYLDEISAIMRDKRILELNNKIVDNKIYVDVQSIKDSELDEAKTLFKMYEQSTSSDIEVLQNSNIQRLIEKLESMGFDIKVIADGCNNQLEKINYQYDILERMFLYIRNQFLFNPKYGLDNYLSTRIRHGTLVNQLRNHFEEGSLITNKKGGKYSHNDYWMNLFGVSNITALQCTARFLEFSERIDCMIFEIKDKYVQVYIEDMQKNEQASFNYDIAFFKDEIRRLQTRTGLNSYNAIVSEIFNILWLHTDKCLEDIKKYLIDVQSKMIEVLHNLERDIINIITRSNPQWASFHDTITSCVNNIQEDFQVVCRWFNRSNYADFDFTIMQVIDTSLGFINRNNKISLKTEFEGNSTTILHGNYFGTIYDIFHDILNNVLEYEQNHNVDRTCRIVMEEVNDYLNIKVINPIDPKDAEILKTTVTEINNNLHSMFNGGRSRMEGNSGCIKIFNAIHNHLRSRNNKYENIVENNMFIVDISLELKPIRK